MLSVKVDGWWLSQIGAYSAPSVSHSWPGGSESASWEMDPGVFHPSLRGSAPVTIYDGGIPIWAGTLMEPNGDGSYDAIGLASQAAGVPCLTVGGLPTTVPNEAIDGAIARGDVQWAPRGITVLPTAWAPAADVGALDLKQLLDGYADEVGMRWQITPTGAIEMKADPTAPQWIVPHAAAGTGLTPAEDEFYSHLVGYYLSAVDTYASETVGSDEAAAAFRRRTGPVDLTDLGVIDSTRATDILTGMFLKVGARMGWAEQLTLSHGQITTLGGTPASLKQVQAGQMIRLAGVVDTSRANRLGTSIDVVIGNSQHAGEEDQVTLKPLGYASRTLADVLKVAIE